MNCTEWRGVDELQDHVDLTLLSAKFSAVFPEVTSLLNSCVEWTLILNDITKDNNKVLEEKSNKNSKFHRL